MEKQYTEINITRERRKHVAGLIIAIVAVNGIVALVMNSELNYVYYDLLRIGSIASAVGLSFAVFAKQGIGGLFGRAYTGLTIGLSLWLAAESIWAYYEIVLGEESPFPSIADAFWLAGYGGLLYYVFSSYKFFGNGIKRYAISGVIGIIAFVAFLYLQLLVSISVPTEGGAEELVLPIAISAAYPVLDFILLVPAILIILNSGKGLLTAIPWVFVSFALTAVADLLLGYSALTGFEDVTVITIMYNSAYLCMSAGLLWYLRYFISERRDVLNS